MERYKILIKPSAVGELEKIRRKKDRQSIVNRISNLSEDPRPRGCEKLSGRADKYRVRHGEYRVVYSVDDEGATVVVVKIGQRKDIYR